MIGKLSTETKQTAQYHVNHLMTKGMIILINYKSLAELKLFLHLCRGVFFCVNCEFFFDT